MLKLKIKELRHQKKGQNVIIAFYANESGKLLCKSDINTGPVSIGETINLISYRDNGGGFLAKEPIYKITAKVDYLDNISELDENNNDFIKRKFFDIPSKHWAKKEIEDLAAKSILSGKSSIYAFNPDDNRKSFYYLSINYKIHIFIQLAKEGYCLLTLLEHIVYI